MSKVTSRKAISKPLPEKIKVSLEPDSILLCKKLNSPTALSIENIEADLNDWKGGNE